MADLVVLKLNAAQEATRRPSKREHDIADLLALLEEHPAIETPELRARLRRIRSALLG